MRAIVYIKASRKREYRAFVKELPTFKITDKMYPATCFKQFSENLHYGCNKNHSECLQVARRIKRTFYKKVSRKFEERSNL
ncbi:hypothetical protein Gasu2_19360 [Galdieria sulphuraria]|nr:hypothetical protein Gasu2_19360 [Galdieria sulphuraria]